MADRQTNFSGRMAANLKHSGTRLILAASLVVILGFALVMWRGGSQLASAPTTLTGVPNMVGGQRKEDDDPQVRKLIEQSDREKLARAQQSGGSAMPTMPDKLRPDADLPGNQLEKADDRYAALPPGGQDRRPPDERNGRAPAEPVRPADTARLQENHVRLVADKQAMMKTLLASWQGGGSAGEAKLIAVTPDKTGGQAAAAAAATESAKAAGPPLIEAGQAVIARNILAISSDKPGTPVVVEVESNKLLGAKLFGTFTQTDAQLLIKLTRMTYNGQDYTINAVAIDPDANTPTLADNSDPRYIQRFGAQLAAQFVAGLAKVASQTGQSSVVTPVGTVAVTTPKADFREAMWAGGASLATGLSSDIAEAAPKGPLAELYGNSGIGVMFLDTVR